MNRNGCQVRAVARLRHVALLILVGLVGWLAVGCRPLSCDTAQTPRCEEQPQGQSVGLATENEPFVCIASQRNNNDATCAPFEARLQAQAGVAAAATCVRVHNLRCLRRTCPNQCVPAGTVTDSSLRLTKNFAACPNPANQDACRLLTVIADCDCTCPEVVG